MFETPQVKTKERSKYLQRSQKQLNLERGKNLFYCENNF
jgi:hypothetical protein